jgi:hypothetical protein
MAIVTDGGENPAARCEVWPQVQLVDDIDEPVLDEDADNLPVPPQVRHTSEPRPRP